MKLIECPVSRTLAFIEGKWKPIILHELMAGSLRASEIARRVPEATPKVLTEQLRELERDGILARESTPGFPPHVEYSFTLFGETLRPVMKELCHWGEKKEVIALAAKKRNRPMAKTDAVL